MIVKINKKQARKLFANGASIMLYACKANINSAWNSPCIIDNRECLNELDNAVKIFDTYVNEFEFYNCNYEMGYYAKYFIESEVL